MRLADALTCCMAPLVDMQIQTWPHALVPVLIMLQQQKPSMEKQSQVEVSVNKALLFLPTSQATYSPKNYSHHMMTTLDMLYNEVR